MTKEEFRTELRRKIGDEYRMTGTASSGTQYTLVSPELVQPDDHWKGLFCHITGTTDDLAPEGESQKIAASTFSDTTLRFELPLTVAPESGDTWALCVFNNSKYDAIVRKTLRQFSKFRPLDFNESMAVTIGNKRFTPTSSSDILRVSKVEFYDASTEDHFVYTDWTWNDGTGQIDFGYWWTESKTLTIYGKKMHTFPSAESTEFTVLDRDIDNFLDLCSVNMLLDMTEREFNDSYGNLNPSMIKSRDIVRDYKGMREQVQQYAKLVMDRILGEYSKKMSLASSKSGNVPAGLKIDKGADGDGVVLPQVFWRVDN